MGDLYIPLFLHSNMKSNKVFQKKKRHPVRRNLEEVEVKMWSLKHQHQFFFTLLYMSGVSNLCHLSSACRTAYNTRSTSLQLKTTSEEHWPPHIFRSSILVLLLLCLALRLGLACVGDPGADPSPFCPFKSHSSGLLLLLSTAKLSLFCL